LGLIYLDSCLLVYSVERHPTFGPPLEQALADRPDEVFAISPLVRMECMVKPLRQPELGLAPIFQAVFPRYLNLQVPEAAYDEAARIRADHNLRTPDALHLAVARVGGCAALWTNDDRFAKAAPGFAVDFRTLARGKSPVDPGTGR
jgi:predicted nucleic acid-binding protein